MKQWPTLYGKTSTNSIKQWQVSTEGTTIFTASSLYGKKITIREKTAEARNVGRANETSGEQQAEREAEALYKKKLEEGYVSGDPATIIIPPSELPMLALNYRDKSHIVRWPWYVQKKLNGVRCLVTLTNDTLRFTSKTGKEYTVLYEHTNLCNNLKSLMLEGQTFDGEIYLHGWGLQRIASAVKAQNEDTLSLQYWVYDIPDRTSPFSLRIPAFKPLEFVKAVETYRVSDEISLKHYHDLFVKLGYEGAILRDPAGLYAYGNRVPQLLKYKEFEDAEFKITGYEVETQCINNKETKSVIFICSTEEGTPFKCRPKGTLEYRSNLLKDINNIIGKYLTIRFSEYSDKEQGSGKGVPMFPIGICIRDYE